jgi:hypothetical protein
MHRMDLMFLNNHPPLEWDIPVVGREENSALGPSGLKAFARLQIQRLFHSKDYGKTKQLVASSSYIGDCPPNFMHSFIP